MLERQQSDISSLMVFGTSDRYPFDKPEAQRRAEEEKFPRHSNLTILSKLMSCPFIDGCDAAATQKDTKIIETALELLKQVNDGKKTINVFGFSRGACVALSALHILNNIKKIWSC